MLLFVFRHIIIESFFIYIHQPYKFPEGFARRFDLGDHSFSTYAKFFEKLAFLPPDMSMSLSGIKIFVFRKMLPTYETDCPLINAGNFSKIALDV